MRTENQTDAVLVALYNATMSFTRQLQWKYYKQFDGDVDDLASEFYMEFLQKKGKEKKSLLDRYDREFVDGNCAQHFNAYIRTAVMRALIDESRTHPWSMMSFDSMLDEFGDSARVSEAMDNSCEDSDTYDYAGMKPSMVARIHRMTPQQFNLLKAKYQGVRSVLAPACVKVFDEVMNPRICVMTTAGMLPIYKISGESVYAVYNGRFEEFNKLTGKAKHAIDVEFTPKGLEYVGRYKRFESDEKKRDFLKVVCK